MLRLQGTGRIQEIAGKNADGSVEIIRDITCPRKHMIDSAGWSKIRRAKKIFAFVSSPKIYKQNEMLEKVQAWCHPFRRPDRHLPTETPSLLLPESDFLDSTIVTCRAPKKLKYDYFYFTINSKVGIDHKGLCTFIDILPELCRKKMKGLIVVYYPNAGRIKRFTVQLSKDRRHKLRLYDKFLTYHWGLLRDHQMDGYMSQCRFGLFPNVVDNSPRIISECLSRDIPILVNNKIHGGWHYVNNQTGDLFTKANIGQKLEFMLSNTFNAREKYESEYGFDKSARKLAKFLNPLFGYNYTHIYFSAFCKRLKKAQ